MSDDNNPLTPNDPTATSGDGSAQVPSASDSPHASNISSADIPSADIPSAPTPADIPSAPTPADMWGANAPSAPESATNAPPAAVTWGAGAGGVAAAAASKPGRRVGRTVGALALGAVVIGGSATYAAINAADRNDDGTITEAGNVDAFDIKAGDCWAALPGDITSAETTEVSSVEAIPCSDPHVAEVIFSGPVTDLIALSTFPGEAKVIAVAETTCLAEFETFVGVDYNSSTLNLGYLFPTQGSWDAEEDRSITCYIAPAEGTSTGSLKGSGQQ